MSDFDADAQLSANNKEFVSQLGFRISEYGEQGISVPLYFTNEIQRIFTGMRQVNQ